MHSTPTPKPQKVSRLSSLVIVGLSLACVLPIALGAVKIPDIPQTPAPAGAPSVMQTQPDCSPTPSPSPTPE